MHFQCSNVVLMENGSQLHSAGLVIIYGQVDLYRAESLQCGQPLRGKPSTLHAILARSASANAAQAVVRKVFHAIRVIQ